MLYCVLPFPHAGWSRTSAYRNRQERVHARQLRACFRWLLSDTRLLLLFKEIKTMIIRQTGSRVVVQLILILSDEGSALSQGRQCSTDLEGRAEGRAGLKADGPVNSLPSCGCGCTRVHA